ncbi:hypothetical protein BKA93DRAFT_555382 [Sparassis latifolia]
MPFFPATSCIVQSTQDKSLAESGVDITPTSPVRSLSIYRQNSYDDQILLWRPGTRLVLCCRHLLRGAPPFLVDSLRGTLPKITILVVSSLRRLLNGRQWPRSVGRYFRLYLISLCKRIYSGFCVQLGWVSLIGKYIPRFVKQFVCVVRAKCGRLGVHSQRILASLSAPTIFKLYSS